MSDESTDSIRYTTAPDGRKIALVSYDIVYEALEDDTARIPPELEPEWESLHDQLTTQPTAVIGRLQDLVERFPQVPVLMNWLAVAYSAAGRMADADAVTDRLVHLHPNYLFGRIQRAQRYLDAGRPDMVREALGGALDLKMMYPHRTKFHVTEVAALWGLLGEHRLAEHDVDGALVYMKMLRKFAEDHPVTGKLSLLLMPHVFKRKTQELVDRRQRRSPKARGASAGPSDDGGATPDLFAPPGTDAPAPGRRPIDEPPARAFRQGSHTPKKDRNRKGRRR
jgi:hypothetical protein